MTRFALPRAEKLNQRQTEEIESEGERKNVQGESERKGKESLKPNRASRNWSLQMIRLKDFANCATMPGAQARITLHQGYQNKSVFRERTDRQRIRMILREKRCKKENWKERDKGSEVYVCKETNSMGARRKIIRIVMPRHRWKRNIS